MRGFRFQLSHAVARLLHALLASRYPLLLEAIRKYTPDDHADAAALDEAIKLAKTSCQHVDRQVQIGGREKVVAIQESIDMLALPTSKQLTLVEDAQPLMLSASAHTFKDNKACQVNCCFSFAPLLARSFHISSLHFYFFARVFAFLHVPTYTQKTKKTIMVLFSGRVCF